MAAPTFQAAGTAVSGTGVVNPPWPAHLPDDIALLFVESTGGESATLSIPRGFVEVAGSPQNTGIGTNGTRITVFWARATSAGMVAPRVADPGNHVYARILTYRGVINTGDPWDVTGGGVKAAASTSVTVTGVTTTVPDTLVVQGVARDNDSAAAAFSAQTNANLTGIAERSDAGTTSGNGGGFAVWDGVMATAGGTGDTTANVASSVNAFLTIALKPQPPPGSVPGGFNAFETSTAAGAITGVIKTKIAGATISLDMIVLNPAKTALLPSFVGAVRVEVLDSGDNSGALDADNCRPSWTTIQTLSPDPAFLAGDNGRKTISFTVANSYPDARLRITYPAGAPTATGCSTDNFAIRPSAFTAFSASDTDWVTAGTTRTLNDVGFGAITHKAGRPLSVRANAVNAAGTPAITTNYAGAPSATMTTCAAGPGTEACTASFGTFTLNTTFVAGQLASDVASYDNVGAFQLELVDSGFAGVDAGDTAGDCTAAGRYVCSASIAVGRFVPDRFAVSYNTPEFGTACGAGSFTYVGQAFNYTATAVPVITVQAQDAANNPATLYTGNWWRITNASLTGKSYTAATGTLDASGITGTDPVINDGGAGSGTLTFSSGTGLFFTRTVPLAPFDAEISLGINVIDADGVAYASNPARFGLASAGNGIAFSSGKQMRFGRLRLENASGPQGNDLPLTLRAEYWNAGTFTTNAAESCLTLVAGNFALSGYTGGISAANMKPGAPPAGNVSISGAFASGIANLRLTRPAPAASTPGGVAICVDLDGGSPTDATCAATAPAGVAWLKGNWGNATTYVDDPRARATFGLFGAQPKQFIFMREYY